MPDYPPIQDAHLEAIARALGATDGGMTGADIERVLAARRMADPEPGTKWKRILAALQHAQLRRRAANPVLGFVKEAMQPARFPSHEEFEQRREAVNRALGFAGFSVTEEGEIRKGKATTTIREAEDRAVGLRRQLTGRAVHPDVLAYCRPELLASNYFHAVLEATKSVASKVRSLSGVDGDGSELVDAVFGLKHGPVLAFNDLQTETKRGEHRGLMMLMKGVFGTFRNPTAHAPRAEWDMSEEDALDIMSTASLLHRRLDNCLRRTDG